MRVTIGLVGVLGFGMSVTVALAQGPAPTRGARLLPPQPLEPGDAQPVARGASEALPGGHGSTPVTRPGVASGGAKPAGGPVWLNGTSAADGGVRTAAGMAGGNPAVRPLTSRDDSAGARGMDKLKTPLGQAHVGKSQPEPRNTATASTPFQGTAPNGQPVYAGPPAYRWYGWGSVTPGANPVAPGGQYPAASANWYSITGATPGAFPVPVMNPMRPAPGTEPPVYVSAPPVGRPGMSPPQALPVSRPQEPTSRNTPRPAETTNLPPATVIPAETPITHASPAEPARPIGVPTMAVPPAPIAPPAAPTHRAVSAEPPAAEPVAVPLPVAPPGPATAAAGPPAGQPTPSPLPVSVTDDQRWQPGNTRPASNDWAPTGGSAAPLPLRPQSRATDPAREPVARGQADENKPDPVAGLIRGLCDGRGDQVEVRWTGTRKLSVGVRCASAAEARRLVHEISSRPELTPYQIDFRVVVK